VLRCLWTTQRRSPSGGVILTSCGCASKKSNCSLGVNKTTRNYLQLLSCYVGTTNRSGTGHGSPRSSKNRAPLMGVYAKDAVELPKEEALGERVRERQFSGAWLLFLVWLRPNRKTISDDIYLHPCRRYHFGVVGEREYRRSLHPPSLLHSQALLGVISISLLPWACFEIPCSRLVQSCWCSGGRQREGGKGPGISRRTP
jgi:hypothetical protein